MSRIGAVVNKVYKGLADPSPEEGTPDSFGTAWRRRIEKFKKDLVNNHTLVIAVYILMALIVLAIIAEAVFQYNVLNSSEVAVEARRAGIDRELQRRKNLIPALSSAAAQYGKHERVLFRHISDSQSLQEAATAGGAGAGHGANSDMTAAMSKLIAFVYNYPVLKATQSVQDLIKEVAETENRVSDAKRDYNQAVEIYNRNRQIIPGKWFAWLYGFKSKPYVGSEELFDVPRINLDVFLESDMAKKGALESPVEDAGMVKSAKAAVDNIVQKSVETNKGGK